MKKLLAAIAVLFVSTTAQAQYTFEVDGRTIRIDPDRGTVSIPGVFDNTGRKHSKKAKTDRDGSGKQQPQEANTGSQEPSAQRAEPPASATAGTDRDSSGKQPPQEVSSGSQQPPAQRAEPPASAAATSAALPTTTANKAPAGTAEPPRSSPASVQQPAQAAASPAASARDPNSPLGLWLTEEKEGKVRIEQCGASLCGYSVDANSDQNGEQILINMKPGKDQQWTGRILDPSNGSTYDSTIAMQGPDRLRVQGCALGGMFCGGQTWSRVN